MPVNITFQFTFSDEDYAMLKKGREQQTDEETFTRVIQVGCSYMLIENLRDQIEQLMSGKQGIYFKPRDITAAKGRLPQEALSRGS